MNKLDSAQFQKILRHGLKYRHNENPKYPEARNVRETDIPNLGPRDEAARQLVASVQESDCQLDDLCQRFHLRHAAWVNEDGVWDESQVDGDAGPATLALTDLPRCGMPDFGDEFGEAGVGGWLKCDPQSEADHSVRILFDDSNAPARWREYLDTVKQHGVDISADIGLDVRYVDGGDYESSVRFKYIAGGVIGYYYLPGRG